MRIAAPQVSDSSRQRHCKETPMPLRSLDLACPMLTLAQRLIVAFVEGTRSREAL